MSEKIQKLPRIASYKPYYYALEKGKKYLWCSCGLSKNQPFCDYSHRDTDFEPIAYIAEEDNQEVLFCACKHNAEGPFCDGAHNNLCGGYHYTDPNSEENQRIKLVAADDNAVSLLDGNCFVAKSNRAPSKNYNNTNWSVLVSGQQGAVHQSLHYLKIAATGQCSPNFSLLDSEVSMLVTAGEGEIVISGKRFSIKLYDGIYIRANEVFSLRSNTTSPLELHLSVCPQQQAPVIVASMPENFDVSRTTRVVGVDEDSNSAMGDRFFQILVDEQTGSTRLTQFIGRIPPSMAAFHRHLYEETLVVLEGEGFMWSDTLKASVQAGDIIFLPRKQIHSLQSTSADGMVLVGFIYPGDNPSINY